MTISLAPGEVFGLLGPNGAGKTTAIKMLTTLLPPTSGTAHIAGFEIVRHANSVRRAIGYVPQMISIDPSLTGYENLSIFAKLYEIPRAERELRISGALALVGLTDAAGKLARQYSGGMIRRLEIAQSTLHRPVLLFLDEPAERLCSRVAIMHRGKIVKDDSPAGLKASVGNDQATLGDVFVHYAGDTLESGGSYRETSRGRRTAKRLG
jgi:ABC-2 type transport system ATP-binding protein